MTPEIGPASGVDCEVVLMENLGGGQSLVHVTFQQAKEARGSLEKLVEPFRLAANEARRSLASRANDPDHFGDARPPGRSAQIVPLRHTERTAEPTDPRTATWAGP